MPNEIKGLNEECGVFGVFGDPQASALTFLGLHNLQHRGQEGAGIVSADNGQLLAHRDLGFLAEVFADENDLKNILLLKKDKSHLVIAWEQTRMHLLPLIVQ